MPGTESGMGTGQINMVWGWRELPSIDGGTTCVCEKERKKDGEERKRGEKERREREERERGEKERREREKEERKRGRDRRGGEIGMGKETVASG